MVKLEGKPVALYLSDEGRRVLRQAGVNVSDTGGFTFDVYETGDRGLWVRIEYPEEVPHLMLIRWDYILAMDVNEVEVKAEGLVN